MLDVHNEFKNVCIMQLGGRVSLLLDDINGDAMCNFQSSNTKHALSAFLLPSPSFSHLPTSFLLQIWQEEPRWVIQTMQLKSQHEAGKK